MSLNCWEFKKCGREPGGDYVFEYGICPAAAFTRADGFNGGNNGGRGCMFIANTTCYHRVQHTYHDKIEECKKCDFYKALQKAHPKTLTIKNFLAHVEKQQLLMIE